MLRVAVVNTRYLQAGGEEIAFEAESNLLAARGHQVEQYEVSNTELLDVGHGRRAWLTVWNEGKRKELARVLTRFQPDVVHFHNTFPLLSPAAYHAVPSGAAIVQTLHNYRLICPGGALLRDGRICEDCVGRLPLPGIVHGCYRANRAATATVVTMLGAHRALGTWRHVDAFVALTEFARALFVRGGLPAARIWVKPNFVFPDPGPGSHDDRHFLFVGRLDLQKGVPLLLEAWAKLDPMPELRIIGDGVLKQEVTRFAERHAAVRYLGPQPRQVVLAEMKRARALILPSLSYENFPLTIAEAFATGLPVLASDTGNLADLVEANLTGWLFRAGDANALAAGVRSVQESASLDQLRRGARARYVERYTADVNYSQLREIYQHARTGKPAMSIGALA